MICNSFGGEEEDGGEERGRPHAFSALWPDLGGYFVALVGVLRQLQLGG